MFELMSMFALLALLGGDPAPEPAAKTLPPALEQVLRDATKVELMSVDPTEDDSGKPLIDGFPITGTIDVTEHRREILAALKKGVAENTGARPACFHPRHAIRAKGPNGEEAELVICFECVQIYGRVTGHGKVHLLTSESPQPYFDELLRRGGVKPSVE